MILNYDGSYDTDVPETFTCVSNGSRPTASLLQWFLDGHPLGDYEFEVIPRENGTSDVRSTLTRTLSREFDGSVLTCAVTNHVLKDHGLPPIKTHF